MFTRRKFLGTLVASGGLYGSASSRAITADNSPRDSFSSSDPSSTSSQTTTTGLIDRAALVKRHNPTLRKLDPLSPLSVGNGEFAFTCDVTGLQTFPAEYENAMPLCTMSQWGWHTTPRPRAIEGAALRLVQYDTHGRQVGYQTSSENQSELFNWLRENPHRLHLGQLGLRLTKRDGTEARAADITDIEQTLDLWTGTITSRFKFEGRPVAVKTSVHPRLDLLAVSVESPLIEDGRLAVRLAFPYGSPKMHAAEWSQPARHQSELAAHGTRAAIRRTLDEDRYTVALAWDTRATFAAEKEHHFLLTPAARVSNSSHTSRRDPRLNRSRPRARRSQPPPPTGNASGRRAAWSS